jgi:hypothetical protein
MAPRRLSSFLAAGLAAVALVPATAHAMPRLSHQPAPTAGERLRAASHAPVAPEHEAGSGAVVLLALALGGTALTATVRLGLGRLTPPRSPAS